MRPNIQALHEKRCIYARRALKRSVKAPIINEVIIEEVIEAPIIVKKKKKKVKDENID